MDSNRADQDFYDAHPDWFCVDAHGAPIRAGERYVSCINSDYYDVYLPAVFREVVERYAPDGFADNSWAGLERSQICHCDNCALRFRDATGFGLPTEHDWSGPSYASWIEWNYRRRVEIWRANNVVTRDAGGDDCRWIGMIGGEMGYNAERFVDVRQIAAETPILFLDHQRRIPREGFAQNAEVGLRMASVLGPGKVAAESMPMYELGGPVFRLAAMPEAEARMWMTEAFAGGVLPWWHHIGSVHDDRRQYATAEPLFKWHREHESWLVDRTPAATVAVVWSRLNNDLAGRDAFETEIAAPYRGVWKALTRMRIPYLPVHIDDLANVPASVRTVVLPEIAVMTDRQIADVRAFSNSGGSVVATGRTSTLGEDGIPRGDFGLGDVFGVRDTGERRGGTASAAAQIESFSRHTYLRLEHTVAERRPPVAGLGDTDIVGFGGLLTVVEVLDADRVPLRFVPEFPIYPPETAWMRAPDSDTPALVLREARDGRGRVAYLAADLDRCYGRDELPDHAILLADLVRWAAHDDAPIQVDGRGDLSVHVWKAAGSTVAHIGNVTTTTPISGRQSELVPSGDLTVRVRVPDGGRYHVHALVSGSSEQVTGDDGWVAISLPPVLDHDVVVVDPVHTPE